MFDFGYSPRKMYVSMIWGAYREGLGQDVVHNTVDPGDLVDNPRRDTAQDL